MAAAGKAEVETQTSRATASPRGSRSGEDQRHRYHYGWRGFLGRAIRFRPTSS